MSDFSFSSKVDREKDIINNGLLGAFNSDSEYIISKDILGELVNIPKRITRYYNNTYFAVSYDQIDRFGYIEFSMKIAKDTPRDGNATAVLEVLEPVDRVGGYHQNINTTTVAIFVDEYNSKFVEELKKTFNISGKDDTGDSKKIKKLSEIQNILERKGNLERLKKEFNKNIIPLEKEHYEKRIKVLKSGDPKNAQILEAFKKDAKKINKMFLDKDSPDYYAKLNQLLDMNLKDEKVNKVTKQILNEIDTDYKNKYNEIITNLSKKTNIPVDSLINVPKTEDVAAKKEIIVHKSEAILEQEKNLEIKKENTLKNEQVDRNEKKKEERKTVEEIVEETKAASQNTQSEKEEIDDEEEETKTQHKTHQHDF